MIHFIKVRFKRSTQKLPQPIKDILKAIGLKKLWEKIIGKYADELDFQTNWAKVYNGKNEELKEFLKEIWKKYRCFDEIANLIKLDDEKIILDVGCGIATVLNILKGKRYGIDPLAEDYKKIYKYPEDLIIKKGFIEKIPFSDEMFDVVFCSNVLDHTTNPLKGLKEIDRVLKKNGYFVLVVEIRKEEIKRDIKHPHSFTLDTIKSLLKNLQYSVVLEKLMPWHSNLPDCNGYIALLQKRLN